MIVSRKMNYNNEYNSIINILNKNGIKDVLNPKDHIYILEENGVIIGVTKVVFKSTSSAFLEYLVIDKLKRGEGFGDGLLRSVLNYCMSKGVSTVYYYHYNSYLMYKGFEKVDNNILKCDLNKFFSRGCSQKRR